MIKNLVTFGLVLAALSSSLQAKLGRHLRDHGQNLWPSRWTEELSNGAGTRNFWTDRGWIIEAVVDHNNLWQTMLYLKANGRLLSKHEIDLSADGSL
jgi:hypothetical protein